MLVHLAISTEYHLMVGHIKSIAHWQIAVVTTILAIDNAILIVEFIIGLSALFPIAI